MNFVEMNLTDFDDIRPFTDAEIPAAMESVAQNPLLKDVVDYIYPGVGLEKIREVIMSVRTSYEFQKKIMFSAMESIVKKTCTGLSYNGFEELDNAGAYIFVSNHRDILLDPAILQYILFGMGKETSQITFGDNLISSDFALLVARCNKMVKVYRSADRISFYRNSMRLSNYMRLSVNELHSSVWLAQRNGRAKDGNDQTEQGVVKLISLSGSKEFVQNLAQMHIRPFAISYQYETCDREKCYEIYVSRRQKYVKAPNEDLNSIINGVRSFKGNVHYQMTDEISNAELQQIALEYSGNDRFCALAKLIDLRIWKGYRLWKTNYMAYDMLTGGETFAKQYTSEDYISFEDYVQKRLCGLDGDVHELREIFLSIYANPVINKINNNINN